MRFIELRCQNESGLCRVWGSNDSCGKNWGSGGDLRDAKIRCREFRCHKVQCGRKVAPPVIEAAPGGDEQTPESGGDSVEEEMAPGLCGGDSGKWHFGVDKKEGKRVE